MVFAGVVVVISGAVVGASIAVARLTGVPIPLPRVSGLGQWKAFQLDPERRKQPGCHLLSRCPTTASRWTTAVKCDRLDESGGDACTDHDPIELLPSIPGNGPAVMTGVSCADPSLCVAVDQSGNVKHLHEPGGGRVAAWIAERHRRSGGPQRHLAVPARASAWRLVAPLRASLTPGSVCDPPRTRGTGRATWTVTCSLDNASALTAVSCLNPFVLRGNRWVRRRAHLDRSNRRPQVRGRSPVWCRVAASFLLQAISCPTITFCALPSTAAGGGDLPQAVGRGERLDSHVTLDSSTMFDSVACVRTQFCVVGGLRTTST